MRRCPTLLVAVLAFGMGLQSLSSRADGLATYTLTSTNGLSAPSGPPPGTAPVTLDGTLSSGSATVSVPSTTGVSVGYDVSGTGIPSGTIVTAVGSNGSQVTLSQDVTTSGGQSLTFTPVIAAPQVVALVNPTGGNATDGIATPPSSSPLGPLTILSGSQGFNTSGVYDYLTNAKENGTNVQLFGLSFYGQGLASLTNGGILKFSLDVANPNAPPQLEVLPPQGSTTPNATITLQSSDTSSGSTSDTGTSTSTGSGTIGTASIPEPLSVLIWSALAGAGLLRARVWRKRDPIGRV
jgi:hypothetical protein